MKRRVPEKELTMMELTRHITTEEAARDYFEAIRWPNGPACPKCGNTDRERIYNLAQNKAKKIRPGLYKCGECRKQFTVTVGTVMERTKLPLHKWLLAFYMMCASKTQVSALQLQRQLEIGSYKTALFLCHRIRYILVNNGSIANLLDGTVEVDEAYVGGARRGVGSGYVANKVAILSAVERGGRVRSKPMGLGQPTKPKVIEALRETVSADADLNTDESRLYDGMHKRFASHATVLHKDQEYVRYTPDGKVVSTNTVEGFFGNSKRAIDGTHHHISKQHTDLYLAELDYKYNTRKVSDGERTVGAIQKIEGERLMYKDLVAKEFVGEQSSPTLG